MSGTTSFGAAIGAGAAFGTAVSRFAAPTARVALANRSTMPTTARRGKRVAIRRAMSRESAIDRSNSSPTEGEAQHGIPRTRDGRGDDGEDAGGHLRTRRLERRRGVLPAERSAGETLEPGLLLRIRGRGLQLEMQVGSRRVARRADETDLHPR